MPTFNYSSASEGRALEIIKTSITKRIKARKEELIKDFVRDLNKEINSIVPEIESFIRYNNATARTEVIVNIGGEEAAL